MPEYDVVGVGLNATDTVLMVPHFPAYAGKVPFEDEHMSPGGQVASALVACSRLGLRTKYIGSVGDDLRGRIQMESLQGTGINLDHVMVRPGCANQSAYIIIDRDGWRYRSVAARRLPGSTRLRTSDRERGRCTSTPRHARGARRKREAADPGDGDGIRFITADRRQTWIICGVERIPTAWTGETTSAPHRNREEHAGGGDDAGRTDAGSAEGDFSLRSCLVVNCVDNNGRGRRLHGAFCCAARWR